MLSQAIFSRNTQYNVLFASLVLGLALLFSNCAAVKKQNTCPELSKVIKMLRQDTAIHSYHSTVAAGTHIYQTLFSRDNPGKSMNVSEEEFQKQLLTFKNSHLANGWIYLIGQAGQEKDSAIVRVYINIMPDQAVSFFERLTGYLDGSKKHYTLKVASTKSGLMRSSSSVLYFNNIDYKDIKEKLTHLVQSMPLAVGFKTVPFAKTIAKGVSVADEPDPTHVPATRKQHSFGSFVSDVLAEVLLENKFLNDRELVLALYEKFKVYGVDPCRLYLSRGHLKDEY